MLGAGVGVGFFPSVALDTGEGSEGFGEGARRWRQSMSSAFPLVSVAKEVASKVAACFLFGFVCVCFWGSPPEHCVCFFCWFHFNTKQHGGSLKKDTPDFRLSNFFRNDNVSH